jgi:predicted acyltransferase
MDLENQDHQAGNAEPAKSYYSNSPAIQQLIGSGERLRSLDFFRGLVMVLLMVESTGLYEHFLEDTTKGSFLHGLAIEFTHHPWHGLHLWDLIQPAFMFIAGTAMAFSLTKQAAKGGTWKQQAIHAVKRSGWLFFWGVLDYAVRGDHLSFELWDVLTQLSFTMLVAFLVYQWKPAYQLLLSAFLLILTEVLYRLIHIPGFDQPFTDQHNFGNYLDWILMRKINPGGWVAINCIPTAAHTIWGAVAGKWLLDPGAFKTKFQRLLTLGLVLLLIGYSLDLSGITPIIKRIATTSFTMVSGGYCLLALLFFYYWIDIRKHQRWLFPFQVVSRNSIFIYLFFEIVVSRWLFEYVNTIVKGVLLPTGLPLAAVLILASVTLFLVQWYLCLWLYRRKIFFKL